MTLIVTTIPEDGAQLAGWLERQLIGLDLARLVAELSAVHRARPTASKRVTDVLAGHLDQIYESGLSKVPRPLLRQLLVNPTLLLELQELVMLHGGPFWDSRPGADAKMEAHVAQGRQRLNLTVRPAPPPLTVPHQPWYRQTWFVSLATAAAVLLLVSGWNQLRTPRVVPAVATWGWDRPGALPAEGNASAYLGKLADAADEWFKKRPETAPELARRLNQMRQGCSTLLLAKHEPLSEEDRKWLKDRCRKWATRFDQQLADLEAGKEVTEVRDATDATVRQLIKALREKAAVS